MSRARAWVALVQQLEKRIPLDHSSISVITDNEDHRKRCISKKYIEQHMGENEKRGFANWKKRGTLSAETAVLDTE